MQSISEICNFISGFYCVSSPRKRPSNFPPRRACCPGSPPPRKSRCSLQFCSWSTNGIILHTLHAQGTIGFCPPRGSLPEGPKAQKITQNFPQIMPLNGARDLQIQNWFPVHVGVAGRQTKPRSTEPQNRVLPRIAGGRLCHRRRCNTVAAIEEPSDGQSTNWLK